jgi:hypothetical protein
MEFRTRDYQTEKESHALPRLRADAHPLSPPPTSLLLPQVHIAISFHFVDLANKYMRNVYSMFLSILNNNKFCKIWINFHKIFDCELQISSLCNNAMMYSMSEDIQPNNIDIAG